MKPRLNAAIVLFLVLSVSLEYRAQAATLSTDTLLGPNHPFPEQTITVIDGLDPPTVVTVIEGA